MSADEPRGPIAIESVPWTEFSEGVRFALKFRVLSDTRRDGRKIGVSYEELPPRKQSVPFHYHLMEEEHIVALEGECTLRLGEQRFTLKAGEYVCFPAGERLGHCLINETDKPFRFIMIGNHEPDEVRGLSGLQQDSDPGSRRRDPARRKSLALHGRRTRGRADKMKPAQPKGRAGFLFSLLLSLTAPRRRRG